MRDEAPHFRPRAGILYYPMLFRRPIILDVDVPIVVLPKHELIELLMFKLVNEVRLLKSSHETVKNMHRTEKNKLNHRPNSTTLK